MPSIAPEEEQNSGIHPHDASDATDSSQLRDDSIGADTDPADPLEQAYNAPSATDPSIQDNHDRSGVAGGPSGDAAAAGRERKKGLGDKLDQRLQTPVGSHTTGGNAKFSRKKLVRRALIGTVGASLLLGVPLLLFFILLPLKLIHMEENIVNYFDNRMQHTIDNRMGANFRAVFDDAGNARGFSYSTGNPISDAYHNYNLNRLESNMKAQGLSAVHDTGGKLVGFTQDTGSDSTRATHATLEGDKVLIRDTTGRVVDTISTSDTTHFSDLRGTKINDRRSFFRQAYADRFPEIGFFRLNIRTRALDARIGIKRRFLENLHEKISDKTLDILNQLKSSFSARVANTDGAPETNQALEQKDKQAIQSAATNNAGDAKGTSFKAAAAGGFSILVQGCGAQAIISSLDHSLLLVRKVQEERAFFIMGSTADQLKLGDLHSSQLSQLMKLYEGFEKAPGWHRITDNPHQKLTDESKFSASSGSKTHTLNNAINNIPLIGPVCGVINSWAGAGAIVSLQVLLAGINAPDGDTADAAIQASVRAAGSVAQGFVFSEAINEVVSLATSAATKPVLDATSPPTDQVDGSIAGYDNYSQDNSRDNGGIRLTPGEVAELNAASEADQATTAQEKGLAYQLLSPNYDHSLVSDLIMKAPLSPGDFNQGADTALAVIANPFNGRLLKSIGSFFVNSSPSAAAYSTATEQEDPSGWGVPQMGLPDELLAKYPSPTDNEQWVINYLCRDHDPNAGLYDGQCDGSNKDGSGELTDKNIDHSDEYHNFIQRCLLNDDPNTYLDDPACTATDEVHERFRVYRLDTQLANMITTYNNSTDDQSLAPAAGGPAAPAPAGASCSSLQDCAKQIQQLHSQGKITYAVDASEIQANIALEADGHQPKFDGTGETITTASPLILEAIVALGQQGTVELNSYIDGASHTDPANPHHMGVAIDVGAFEGKTLGSGNVAETQKVEGIVGQILPAHSRFGADFYTDASWTAPITVDGKVFYTGNDAPAHLHFDVLNVSGG